VVERSHYDYPNQPSYSYDNPYVGGGDETIKENEMLRSTHNFDNQDFSKQKDTLAFS
jgi:hypothetical protein